MTEKELKKLPVLHKALELLWSQICDMEDAQEVFAAVRGGVAGKGGKGHVILVKGAGHDRLGIKIQEYRIKHQEYMAQVVKLERWLDKLPENTVEDMKIKIILQEKYRNNLSNREIGASLGCSEGTVRNKLKDFWAQ